MKTFFNLLIILAVASCTSIDNDNKETSRFEPTVESLKKYQCPEWFRDAKFGIYMHWGPYSVAEQGEWYARRLYEQGRPEYEHHLKNYGHPSGHGYKDFIPKWKAENFDPDTLLALFKRAGAKYFTPCAVHHDNFDLWNSKHHRWNAVNMGPKRDLIGEFREATIKAGLKFGVTTHLSRSYSWLNVANQSDSEGPYKGVPYDGQSDEATGLYPPMHDDTHQRAALNAPKEWRDLWKKRIIDLIDNYHPDHLYFDCAIPFRGEDKGKTGMEVISHLYNHSMDRNNGSNHAVMCIKERPWQGYYASGLTTLDFERGKASYILDEPWQTDDSMGPWGYHVNKPYTTAGTLVDKIIDIVSKNGNMLLNVPIRADGTLDETAIKILEDIGRWMNINGEAIFGSRPWYRYGEGHTVLPHFVIESPFTYKDIRYTTKGNALYVFVLDWPPKSPVEFPYLTDMNPEFSGYKHVELLGHTGELAFEKHADGLRVYFPDKKPCDFAYVLKITR